MGVTHITNRHESRRSRNPLEGPQHSALKSQHGNNAEIGKLLFIVDVARWLGIAIVEKKNAFIAFFIF